MKKTTKAMRLCLELSLIAWSVGVVAAAQETSRTTPKAGVAEPHKQNAAIRASVEQFVKAYNAHDAKTVAELFLLEAQIVNEDDSTIQSRSGIEGLFARVFAESPQTKSEVTIESFRFIGTTLASETGSSKTRSAPGERAVRRAARRELVVGAGPRHAGRADSPRTSAIVGVAG